MQTPTRCEHKLTWEIIHLHLSSLLQEELYASTTHIDSPSTLFLWREVLDTKITKDALIS